MRQIEQHAIQAYQEQFGGEPEIVASAPGRINLIGEHTDYNGGFVLPCAIDRRTAVAMGRGEGQLFSVDYDELCPLVAHEHPQRQTQRRSWADYPRGVAWALGERGAAIPPFRAAIVGEVPRGSGLSSSAALEAATALALDALYQLRISKRDLALACQRAENEYVGARTGIMDQYASLLCQPDAALLIDCRSLKAQTVPLDLAAAGLALFVCDTQTPHENSANGYNDRRAACERAAETLGVTQLRDASEASLEKLSGEELKRARHVITENARVLASVEALRRHDFTTFGQLMYESHRSMRDDYEISTPELDTFVEVAAQTGAVGARLTGAGFGGCAIALIARERVETLAGHVRQQFQTRGYRDPAFYEFRPATGAEVVQQGS